MGIEAKWKSRGIRVGKLPCGPLDKISDVPGVTVGHCTLADGTTGRLQVGRFRCHR